MSLPAHPANTAVAGPSENATPPSVITAPSTSRPVRSTSHTAERSDMSTAPPGTVEVSGVVSAGSPTIVSPQNEHRQRSRTQKGGRVNQTVSTDQIDPALAAGVRRSKPDASDSVPMAYEPATGSIMMLRLPSGGSDDEGDLEEEEEEDRERYCCLPRRVRPGEVRLGLADTLLAITDSHFFNGWMFLVTLYALFGDDFRLWLLPKSMDTGLSVVSTVCLFMFVYELCINMALRPNYAVFYFWLDIMAVLSMIPEIPWIWDPLLDALLGTDSGQIGSTSDTEAFRAGRAARAGTKAGRLVRIVRLVRLIRIAKLYQEYREMATRKAKRKGPLRPGTAGPGRRRMLSPTRAAGAAATARIPLGAAAMSGSKEGLPGTRVVVPLRQQGTNVRRSLRSINALSGSFEDDVEVTDEKPKSSASISQVGAELSDLTTRRLILIVLSMLLVLPLMESFFVTTESPFEDHGLELLHRMPQDLNVSEAVFKSSVQKYALNAGHILQLSICPATSGCQHTWRDEVIHGWLKELTPTYLAQLREDAATAGVAAPVMGTVDGWTPDQLLTGLDQIEEKYRKIELQQADASGCFLTPKQPQDPGNDPTADIVCESMCIFDARDQSQRDAAYSALRTVFVMVLIGAGAILFTQDAEQLVIVPIERMVQTVKQLAKNPLQKLHDIQHANEGGAGSGTDPTLALEGGKPPKAPRRLGAQMCRVCCCCLPSIFKCIWFCQFYVRAAVSRTRSNKVRSSSAPTTTRSQTLRQVADESRVARACPISLVPPASNTKTSYETSLLENTLFKVAGLLQVGFGEAGADIIMKNIHQQGTVDPLIPGQKVEAVFGFCDIRNFTDVTECLQERVMVFVNVIGWIVHRSVHQYDGAANKNIGDAFLLVWKLRKRKASKKKKPRRLETQGVGGTARGKTPTTVSVRNSVPSRPSFKVHPSGAGPSVMDGVLDAPPTGNPVLNHGTSVGARGSDASARRVTPLRGSRHSGGTTPSAGARGEGGRPGTAPHGSAGPSQPPRASGGNASTLQYEPISERCEADGDTRLDSVHAPEVGRADSTPTLMCEGAEEEDGMGECASVASGVPPRTSTHVTARRRGSPAWTEEQTAIKTSLSDKPQIRQAHRLSHTAVADAPASAPAPPPSIASFARRSSNLDRGRRGSVRMLDQGLMSQQSYLDIGESCPDVASQGGVGRMASGRAAGSMQSARELPDTDATAESIAVDDDIRSITSYHGHDHASMRQLEQRKKDTTRAADNALAAFLKALVDIHVANQPGGELFPFLQDPVIMERFPNGYKVQMGFGLHIGWAIEGAIGSKFKVDASYLSPHVNMAARLESATKMYGVSLLISRPFAEELSSSAQYFLRLIDRVKVKGSDEPMELYTFDIENYPSGGGLSIGQPRLSMAAGLNYNASTNSIAMPVVEPSKLRVDFESKQMASLQHGLSDTFFTAFEAGIQSYLAGDWDDARAQLRQVKEELRPDDGPSTAILDFIGNRSAPDDWPGYRTLFEK